jgi:hypothetical protein
LENFWKKCRKFAFFIFSRNSAEKIFAFLRPISVFLFLARKIYRNYIGKMAENMQEIN